MNVSVSWVCLLFTLLRVLMLYGDALGSSFSMEMVGDEATRLAGKPVAPASSPARKPA
jgi:hypothetical protein